MFFYRSWTPPTQPLSERCTTALLIVGVTLGSLYTYHSVLLAIVITLLVSEITVYINRKVW